MKLSYVAPYLGLLTALFTQGAISAAKVDHSELSIQERLLIVTAELQDTNVLELANSVSVISQDVIENRSAHHLSDLFNLAPNVNFATGASRGRFIQIRGIGERSEFSEPVNYSVGVVLDGIDLTGISTAATTLDIQQVEILRGPQGTLYGANGLAGLINLVSNSPTSNEYSKLSASLEEYSGKELTLITSGPASENLGYRFAIKKYQSNGYVNNIFLNREDTNNIDELSLRAKFVYQINSQAELTSSLFFADIDNGYDAFSLDSNRNTYSDQPGFDTQETHAAAFNIDWRLNDTYWIETTLSTASSDLGYAYDEDWSHTGICSNTACDSSLFGFDWWYSSFDNYQRQNKNTSLDIKLHSDSNQSNTNWVLGAYLRKQQIDLIRQYTYLDDNFTSKNDTNNFALYGQLTTHIAKALQLVGGLRFEKRGANYSDSDSIFLEPKENLWGGKLSLEYHYQDSKMVYGLISRGYKTGGFNTDGSIPPEYRLFDTEFMWNYEIGLKGNWLDNDLILQVALFYQDRKDIQSKQSIVRSIESQLTIQNEGICPCSFTDFIRNGPKGASTGLEVELEWQLNDDYKLYSSLGLLEAKFDKFKSYNHINADQQSIPPVPFDLSGRNVAHAPNYQAVLGGFYYINDSLTINMEIESKDAFYFSDRHPLKADAYNALNLRLTYQKEDWRIQLYANNITDESVQTRGFGSFGNDPRNFYERGNYFQYDAPRVIGISASLEFE